MKVFQDIKPSGTRKMLLNRKGQNYFVPERGTCIILSSNLFNQLYSKK